VSCCYEKLEVQSSENPKGGEHLSLQATTKQTKAIEDFKKQRRPSVTYSDL
jgi:hypothetical protein